MAQGSVALVTCTFFPAPVGGYERLDAGADGSYPGGRLLRNTGSAGGVGNASELYGKNGRILPLVFPRPMGRNGVSLR